MERRYDLLVLDLDGTLLDPSGAVSEANRRAVDALRQQGTEIIVATGRALVESLSFLAAVDHRGLVIAAGGALLNDAATGRTLNRCLMSSELVVEVTEALLPHGHKVLLLKDAEVTGYDYLAVGPAELDPASEWWFETLPVRVRFVHRIDQDPHPDQTVRVGAVGSAVELAPIAETLIRQVGPRAFIQHWGAVTETTSAASATHVLEVFSPSVNKWTMVAGYCRRRGIDRRRVAAIGDGLNDVELVREAALGIAMGNADPRVRAVADQVTADNASDGVARAIEHILAERS